MAVNDVGLERKVFGPVANHDPIGRQAGSGWTHLRCEHRNLVAAAREPAGELERDHLGPGAFRQGDVGDQDPHGAFKSTAPRGVRPNSYKASQFALAGSGGFSGYPPTEAWSHLREIAGTGQAPTGRVDRLGS